MVAPTISIIAAGSMGAAVAERLTKSGCTVLTNLTGRSESTKSRATVAGMQDVSFEELISRSDWFLSILPPSQAFDLAQQVSSAVGDRKFVYVDCNAINKESLKRIAKLFEGTSVGFVDAGIIGLPPKDEYDPTFYAAADEPELLDLFVSLSQYGLKVSPLLDGAGVGDASALKMSYAGIAKGTTGLITTMILAAHASSPATATALLKELNLSQPTVVKQLTARIPDMIPKAYRWVGEMEEISEFIGEGEGEIFQGIAKLYRRIEKSRQEGEEIGDVGTLKHYVEEAKKLQ